MMREMEETTNLMNAYVVALSCSVTTASAHLYYENCVKELGIIKTLHILLQMRQQEQAVIIKTHIEVVSILACFDDELVTMGCHIRYDRVGETFILEEHVRRRTTDYVLYDAKETEDVIAGLITAHNNSLER